MDVIEQSMWGTGLAPGHALYRWVVVGMPLNEAGMVLAASALDAACVLAPLAMLAWVWLRKTGVRVRVREPWTWLYIVSALSVMGVVWIAGTRAHGDPSATGALVVFALGMTAVGVLVAIGVAVGVRDIVRRVRHRARRASAQRATMGRASA